MKKDNKSTSKKYTINFSDEIKVQDMVNTIAMETNLPLEEAIVQSITKENHDRILDTGWGAVAVHLWRHAEPEHEFVKMEKPSIMIEVDEEKAALLQSIMRKANVSLSGAIQQFMIFTLESMGYHI